MIYSCYQIFVSVKVSSEKTNITINLCCLYSSYADDPATVLYWTILILSTSYLLPAKSERANGQVLQEGLPFSGFSNTKDSLHKLHSHNNLSRCWAERPLPPFHPCRKSHGFWSAQGFLCCTWVESRQRYSWVQILMWQSVTDAVSPLTLPDRQLRQAEQSSVSLGFSSKMKVSVQEQSHRMGEDGQKGRISQQSFKPLMCYTCFQNICTFYVKKGSPVCKPTFLHLHETDFLYNLWLRSRWTAVWGYNVNLWDQQQLKRI